MKLKYNNEYVDKLIDGREFIRISEARGLKVKFRCTIDGHEWTTLLNCIRDGAGCPKCSKNAKLSDEVIDFRLVGRSMERLSRYVNSTKQMLFRCLVDGCGHKWKTAPNHKSSCRVTGFVRESSDISNLGAIVHYIVTSLEATYDNP